jgi:hypothetical protein
LEVKEVFHLAFSSPMDFELRFAGKAGRLFDEGEAREFERG